MASFKNKNGKRFTLPCTPEPSDAISSAEAILFTKNCTKMVNSWDVCHCMISVRPSSSSSKIALGALAHGKSTWGRRCSLKLGASGFDDGHLNQTRKLIWDALGALGIISQFHVTSQHCLVGPSVQIQLLRCFANLRHICQRATEVVFRIWKVCQEHSNATGNTCQMCIKWKKEEKRHQ